MRVIAQIGIFVFGVSAIWILGRKEKWRRWGYILGLCSQPFFIYAVLASKQYGMFILSLFYTYSWIQGIYNYWIKKQKDAL